MDGVRPRALGTLVLGARAAVRRGARLRAGTGRQPHRRRARRAAQEGPAGLATLRAAAIAANHPLAMWADYWELGNRLNEAQQPELDAFYARWPSTYVEDRLRNDWLLELGKRRDWANFAVEYPRFRMNDDREVTCYALLVDHLAGKDVREAALGAWIAQKDSDDGCALLSSTLYEARKFTAADAWRRARFAMDSSRPRVARQAAALVNPAYDKLVAELADNPARHLARHGAAASRNDAELATLALMRMAGNDPEAAARQLDERWDRALPTDLAAWAWASVAQAVGDEAAARFGRVLPARRAARRQVRPGPRLARGHARVEGARRAARRQRPHTLAAGAAGDQRDEPGRAARGRPGSTGRRAACRPWRTTRRTARACARLSRELLPQHRRAGQLLRQARDRGTRRALRAAQPSGRAAARGRTGGGATTPACSARCS